MLDFIIFYSLVGFFLNTGIVLFNLYFPEEKGYVRLPEPFIWFVTIFSWPYTLYQMICSFGKERNDD